MITEANITQQSIDPLRIAILNLMPTPIAELLRLLRNTSLQVDIEHIKIKTYAAKDTSQDEFLNAYKTFDQIKNRQFDGFVITGAPVERMEFEKVDYWQEICEILEWTKTNVTSTFHICWGAQAGLYYHYGIKKHVLPNKLFGIYEHTVLNPHNILMRGFDDTFLSPHCRWANVDEEAIKKCPELEIVSAANLARAYIITSRNCKHIFVLGHPDYDGAMFIDENKRDIEKGLNITLPRHYFVDNDPTKPLNVFWDSHANRLFSNWLHHIRSTTPE